MPSRKEPCQRGPQLKVSAYSRWPPKSDCLEPVLPPAALLFSQFGSSQPPIRPDEQRVPLHPYLKSFAGVVELGVTRSTQANLQPLTHSMVVSPLGASTTTSKAGADVCALPSVQPRNVRIAPTRTWIVIRAVAFMEVSRQHYTPQDLVVFRDPGISVPSHSLTEHHGYPVQYIRACSPRLPVHD